MNRRVRMKNLLKDIVMNILLKDLFLVFVSKFYGRLFLFLKNHSRDRNRIMNPR